MQNSVHDKRESYPRHFTDVFSDLVALNGDRYASHRPDDTTKLRRRPKCKTKNKCGNESGAPTCGNSCYKSTLSVLPKSTVIAPSLSAFGGVDDAELRELVFMQTAKFSNTNVQRSKSWPVFDVLCETLKSSENVVPHKAAALSRWLCHRQAIQPARSSSVPILLASKCPLVSFVCCRILKQSHLMHDVMSCTCTFLPDADCPLASVDVVSYVLSVQRELVKFLETGRFSMNLLNMICLLDCITATCRDILAHCNKLCANSRFYSRWSSSELRWAVLSVISLANAICAKVNLNSTVSPAADASSSNYARSISLQVARVPQIFSLMLTTSVQCEVARAANIYRILNEYWHTTDFRQRRLIVESVLVPKLKMELCIMILAGHCDFLLRECFASSLSLDDILCIFDENVLIAAIAQQVWMEGNSSSVACHCREMCVLLCDAVCSYVQYQKETRGHLLDNDVMALQQLPDYAAAVKKRLSEISRGGNIMDIISVSALDRLSCLADVC